MKSTKQYDIEHSLKLSFRDTSGKKFTKAILVIADFDQDDYILPCESKKYTRLTNHNIIHSLSHTFNEPQHHTFPQSHI